jgi:hypothetical protein
MQGIAGRQGRAYRQQEWQCRTGSEAGRAEQGGRQCRAEQTVREAGQRRACREEQVGR